MARQYHRLGWLCASMLAVEATSTLAASLKDPSFRENGRPAEPHRSGDRCIGLLWLRTNFQHQPCFYSRYRKLWVVLKIYFLGG
jgi:hypothetical protein